jgi:hypothetical protein
LTIALAVFTMAPLLFNLGEVTPSPVVDNLEKHVREVVPGRGNVNHARHAERVMWRLGYREGRFVLAALVNAYHESGWDPKCVSGQYIGLFQLGVRNGAGRGYPVEYLKTVKGNVYAMSSTSSWKQLYLWTKKNPSAKTSTISYKFAQSVEVCHVSHREARRGTAGRWDRALPSRK